MTSHGVPRSSTTVRTPQAIQADLLKIEAYNNLVSEVQALSETLLRTLEWMRELLDEEPDCRLLLEEMIFVGSLLRDLDETEEEEDVDRDEVKRDMQSWLEKLMEVDPMRGGRWREMQEKLM
ncbi:hypothetical protein TWF192_006264 [Orbilia oligospora]|nr:hypothetical protein TWF192_006264 [Orbilia oligospora]